MIKSQSKIATSLFLLLITLLSYYFWQYSRFPDLEGKLTEVGFSGFIDVLSNRPAYELNQEMEMPKRIGVSYLNWIIANKNGMIFGILLASLFMSLFSTLKIERLESNDRLSGVLGTVWGIPLGLCVNCAAPLLGGALPLRSTLFGLSIMLASPNLNFIILPFAAQLIPLKLIVIKVSLTLVMIFVVLPLISKNEEYKKKSESLQNNTFFNSGNLSKELSQSAFLFLKSFWFIVKKSVPLMFLAGLLGAILTHIVPFDQVEEWGIGASVPVAVVSSFLPVPVTFDVVLANIFIEQGFSFWFCGIIYYGLSSYSLYAFFIVGQFISYRLSLKILLVTIFFSLLCGFSFNYFSMNKSFQEIGAANSDNVMAFKPKSFAPLEDNPAALIKKEGYSIKTFNHRAKVKYSKEVYTFNDWGLDYDVPSLGIFAEPELGTAKVLSNANISGDMREEVLISHESGLRLLTFTNNNRIEEIALPSFPGRPLTGALVDFNDDGLADIVASSFFNGVFVNYNLGTMFSEEWVLIPNTRNRLSGSFTFYDYDLDGRVDLHLANSFIATYRKYSPNVPYTRNFVILNKKKGFFSSPTPDIEHGETLANLFTDTNNDGLIDLITVNDFGLATFPLLNRGDSRWVLPDLEDELTAIGSGMSVDSADINLDGNFETFIGGSFHTPTNLPREALFDDIKLCESWGDKKGDCQETVKFNEHFSIGQKRLADISKCKLFKKEQLRDECRSIISFWNISHVEDPNKCKSIKDFILKNICLMQMNKERNKKVVSDKLIKKSKMGKNALYFSNTNGWSVEAAEKYGIDQTCWTWGSKFGDLDNDQYEDIVFTNGFVGVSRVPCKTLYFKNREGMKFDYLKSGPVAGASVLLLTDFDFDGDLDQVFGGAVIPYSFVPNNIEKKSMTFDFQKRGSPFRLIGARVSFELSSGKKLQRELHFGDGYTSVQSLRQHVGTREEDIVGIKLFLSRDRVVTINEVFSPGHHYIINLD